MTKIYPVIMAGGVGSRLWPLSRQRTPKQFQALVTNQTMLEETIRRVALPPGVDGSIENPIIICGEDHRHQVAGIMADAGLPLGSLILEPMGRNTAPAAIVASLEVAASDPEGLVLLLPADHHVATPASFQKAIAAAAKAARAGYVTTFGIKPSRPETGYGYIKACTPLTDGVLAVDAFVEKPNAPTAEQYIAEGTYSWNAGIFLFSAKALLAEADRHASDILAQTSAAYQAATRDGNVVTLDAALFGKVTSDSIDYAIMEHTEKAAMAGPVEMGWNDIGSWRAVRDQLVEDDKPLHVGNVTAIDSDGSFIRSTGPKVTAIGVSNMVIVATADAVLVMPAERSQDVKSIVDQLKTEENTELL
ncbi:MAG: mannose-1-phosphate guanylyltransferase/mannose-6-phosphate isomerase [Pseudomonadota bacterium]